MTDLGTDIVYFPMQILNYELLKAYLNDIFLIISFKEIYLNKTLI